MSKNKVRLELATFYKASERFHQNTGHSICGDSHIFIYTLL